MAIQFNDNLNIAAPKPLDRRYLNVLSKPYSNTTEVNGSIDSTSRYTGLTVNIGGAEYWYKDGIADIDLVLKTSEGGNASGERIEKEIIQANSFSIGEVIGFSGGTYVSALSTVDFDGEIHGIASQVSVSGFTIVYAGYVTGLTAAGLAANTTYFASDTVSGNLTSTQPTAEGSIIKPMLTTTATADEALVFQYLGVTVSTGLTATYITGGTNFGGGNEIFSGATGENMLFRTISGSGDTKVTTVGNEIIIETTGATNASEISTAPIYNATEEDRFISASGTSLVTLSGATVVGRIITISDIEGNAFVSPITVDASPDNILDSPTGVINTDYGSVTLVWNGVIWSVIGFTP